jgi:uncharacterized protein (DUF1499 family)
MSISKYREENVSGIKDDKQRIKENMKKIKEKLIQRINQVEKELTNKLDILVQENTKFEEDEISKVFEITDEVELYLKEMLLICCSQMRLGFFNSAEYDVFRSKSTTW